MKNRFGFWLITCGLVLLACLPGGAEDLSSYLQKLDSSGTRLEKVFTSLEKSGERLETLLLEEKKDNTASLTALKRRFLSLSRRLKKEHQVLSRLLPPTEAAPVHSSLLAQLDHEVELLRTTFAVIDGRLMVERGHRQLNRTADRFESDRIERELRDDYDKLGELVKKLEREMKKSEKLAKKSSLEWEKLEKDLAKFKDSV